MLETYVLDMLFDLYQDDGFGNRMRSISKEARDSGDLFIFSDPYLRSFYIDTQGY